MRHLNNVSKVFFLLLLTISVFSNLNGQNCISYPNIEGAPCKDCAPNGWIPYNMFQTYPHIIPPVNAPLPDTNCNSLTNISGPSPSGGNVQALFGSSTFPDITSISTTIYGLNTNITYTFGIYWEGFTANCATTYTDGVLRIYIEGQLYEFEDATEWELAEVCFTPTSSSVEIVIATFDAGTNGAIIIDGNFDCSIAQQCCVIKPTIEVDNYSICPEETIALDANYTNNIGAVQVEWTCDPPEGLDYLSSTSITSPSFMYPATPMDYEGETFKFTLSVEDDVCVQTIECIEVVVRPSIAPVFEIEFCDLDFTAVLPTESQNGYSGSWEGDTNIEFVGGTSIPFTFTLNDDENNCIESYDYEFYVNEGYIPNFDIDDVYCISDDNVYILPPVSPEFVEGDWIPINQFNPSELGEGAYTFTFVPDSDFCAIPYEFIINIVPGSPPSFDLPEQFCSEPSFFVLPQESMDGVSGSWSIDSIDLSIPVQNDVLVFTPEGSGNCSGEFNYEYSINESITPLFNLPESICNENSVISFDPVTTQNITGSWTPSEFNPDTVSTFITAIWMPENQDSCILPLEITIPIFDKATINLDLPETLCSGDMTYNLPDIDTIAGSWNFDVIDLANNIDSTIIVLYVVDENQCYVDFADTIFVSGLEVPQFSIVDSYCSTDAVFTLPETSDNSVLGEWNINSVDPSMQDSLVIIFTPNSGGCDDIYSQTIYFSDVLDPIFNIPQTMCEIEDVFTFPIVSDNGINGSWTNDTLDPSMIDQNTFSNTFTPDDPSCTSTFSISIEILSFKNVSVQVANPTSCEAEDGSIQIVGASTDMQQSIDNGATWTPITVIENLASGSYNIQLRFQNLPICTVVYLAQLNSSESPNIQELIPTDPSSCGQEDGSIECIAEGSDLEYSIDNISWQTSNIFENLTEGNYIVYVRLVSEMDCVSSASAELKDPVIVEICDGIDNNCDGEIDENFDTKKYYADWDMDGYGDLNDLIISCFQPQSYVIDSTDCDDNNHDIFPGADEIPDNGIDEDCNGMDLITSVHELADQKIDIYPNPTNGLVTIKMEDSRDITLSLYNVNGKCLIHQGQSNSIDLSEYANGIYLIKITDQESNESIVEKIVLYK